MTLSCPNCHSQQIDSKNQGRKTASTIGSVAGAADGASKMLNHIHAIIPIKPSMGSVVLSGFIGAVAGGVIGSKFGEFVDDNILDNYLCLKCGYTFSKQPDQT